jgi:hypothetical protein
MNRCVAIVFAVIVKSRGGLSHAKGKTRKFSVGIAEPRYSTGRVII